MCTWKSDTATAIDGHPKFAAKYREIERRHSNTLYLYIQTVLPGDHKRTDAVNSIYKELIAPAIALARKVGIHYTPFCFLSVATLPDNNRLSWRQASGSFNTLNGATANGGI